MRLFVDIDRAARFYARQAALAAPMRRHLYRKAGLRRKRKVLDVGCGTGEVTSELAKLTSAEVTGVDSDSLLVEYATETYPEARFATADSMELPFDGGSFDLVTCQFLLMWVDDPDLAVTEMARVLQEGGIMLACAEPDYGGHLEYPEHPEFSRAIEESLIARGADPYLGRKLWSLLRERGLGVEVGVSATALKGDVLKSGFEFSRDIFLEDLELVMGPEKARAIMAEEDRRVESGKMRMVPLFWALGHKQG